MILLNLLISCTQKKKSIIPFQGSEESVSSTPTVTGSKSVAGQAAVAAVNAPTAAPNTEVTITINFDNPVDVGGTIGTCGASGDNTCNVTLKLSNGQTAYYAGGSGTNSITFVVKAADNPTGSVNYQGTDSLVVNTGGGATLKVTGTTNDANKILPPPSAAVNTGTAPDTIAPLPLNITSTNANQTYATGAEIYITVEYNEIVNVTGTPQYKVNTTNGTRYADYVSGAGSTTLTFKYVVQAADTTNGADLTFSNFTPVNGTIKDASGNAASTTLPTKDLAYNKDIKVNAITQPTVLSVNTSTVDGTYGQGAQVEFSVKFTEAVTMTCTTPATNCYITLSNGAKAVYVSGTGTDTLVFRYTVGAGDTSSSDLTYQAVTSLNLAGGATITSTATGGAADKTLPDPTTNFTASHDIVINPSLVQPTISFTSGGTGTVAENAGSYTVNFTLSGAYPNPITFTIASSGGTATSGTDFTAINQTVTIPANATSGSVSVTINDDTRHENNEIFTLTMSNPTNAVLSGTNAQNVTITDNDAAPTLNFSAANYSVNEPASGTTTVQVTVALTGNVSDVDTTVNVATSGGTATAGGAADYVAYNQTITITAGQTSGTATITVNSDTIYEGAETFNVAISTPAHGVLGATTTAVVTINDGQSQPTISFSDAGGNAANGGSGSIGEGGGNYTLYAKLSGTTQANVTVNVSTTNGSATAGSDYTGQTNTVLTITAGQTTGSITIPITQDTNVEGNENFTATLSSPSTNATLTGAANATQTITIVDDDLGISSVVTMDSDGNGKIDAYKVTFTTAITDANLTSLGYSLNALGSAQTNALVSGYTNVKLANGTAAPEADTQNDAIIYFKFTEGGSFDTDAKPDFTTNVVLTFGSYTLQTVGTSTVTEADGARPVIVSAAGTIGSSELTVTYSEAVYGTQNAPACGSGGQIASTQATYTNTNSAGAASVSSMADNCAAASDATYTTPKIAKFTTNVNFISGDNNSDTISFGAGTLYDAANNQISTTPKAISVGAGNPPVLTLLEELDTNGDGKLDKVRLTFDLPMDDSTISTNLAQFTLNGVTATGFSTGTTANDTVVELTVSGMVTGTDFKTVTYTKSGTGSLQWLGTNAAATAGFTYSTTGAVALDKAAPVIVSAVAADPAPNTANVDSGDTLTITFSEDITTAGKAAVTNANVMNYINLPAGTTWPSVTSVTWSDNKTMVITFGGTGTISDDSLITAVGTAGNNFPDASANYASSNATMTGSFTTDLTPPYITLVIDTTPASGASNNTVLVKFSEAMNSTSATTLANYTSLIKTSDSSSVSLTGAVITQVTSDTYKITLGAGVTLTSGAEYKLTATTSVKDLANNALTDPKEGTFIAQDALRVLSAKMTTTTTVLVTFSRLVDTSGSATCASSSACAVKFYITPTLGNITSSSVSDNVVTLTLDGSVTPKGISYTFVGANGITGDDPSGASASFDAVAGDAIKDGNGAGAAGAKTLSGVPQDRITFTGLGTVVNDFSDGWFMEDPFADNSVFSFTFKYKGKVYVGPNTYNNTTLRFDTDGKNVISNTFANSLGASSSTCPSSVGFGYGFTSTPSDDACSGPGTFDYGGPNQDRGMVGFTALTVSSNEFLMAGPIKSGPGWGYFSQDIDNKIDLKVGNYQNYTAGGNTKSIQTYFADGTNVYAGFACNHGTQAPIMIRNPVTVTSGTITFEQVKNQTANLNLDASSSFIGKARGNSGGWVNSADAIGTDSVLSVTFSGQTKRMYIGNSIGIASSTDYTDFDPAVQSEPTGIRTVGQTNLVLPGIKSGGSYPEGLLKVSPGQRGVPFLKFHNSKLYAARNVSVSSSHSNGAIGEDNKTPSYTELYVCGTPSAGTAGSLYCNGSDWSLVFTTKSTVSDGTRFDSSKSDNIAMSMFEITPNGVVYLGFDSPSGFRVYRNTFASADITNSGWTQEGPSSGSKDGFGDSAYNKIQSSAYSQDKNNVYYVYITVGGYNTSSLWYKPIRVFRQADDGTARVAFLDKIPGASQLLAYLKAKSGGNLYLPMIALVAAIIGLGYLRRHRHHA